MASVRAYRPVLQLFSVFLLSLFPSLARSDTPSATPSSVVESDAEAGDECTGYLVVGEAGRGQSFFHKNRDSSSWREGVALVVPAEGYKYLAVHTQGSEYGTTALSGLNEKGVGAGSFAGFSTERAPDGPGPSSVVREALQYGGTAEEYARKFGDLVAKHGISSAGGRSAAVDPNEGWLVEYAGHKWDVEGPFVDDYAPTANVYTITSMKKYEVAPWQRFARLRKAREVLERGLYPNAPGEKWPRTWNIDKAFAWARNTEPLECPLCGTAGMMKDEAHSGACFGGSDPRPICTTAAWGRPGRTVSAHIVTPHKKYPGYLSVLWWSLDRPCDAPFIPLYIGVTKVPDAISVTTCESSDTFYELCRLLHDNPEYHELASSVWRKFELRQHRYIVERLHGEVAASIENGDEAEAHRLLTEFVQRQVDEVMDLARRLISKIKTESEAQLSTSVQGRSG